MNIKLRMLALLFTHGLQPLIARIDTMNTLVQQLVDKVAEQTQRSEGVRVLITQAIAEMVDLKAKLTAAIASAGSLSDEDKAAIQQVIDNAGTDSALDETAAQELADAIAVNAPSN